MNLSESISPAIHLVSTDDQMRLLGEQIGGALKAGDLVILRGELGAGKTTFTQGVGIALGFEEISSPTFVISRVHNGKPSLIHVDAYRLLANSTATLEFDDLDLDTQREDAIVVVEWGSDLAVRLDEHYLLVDISFTGVGDERKVEIAKR